MGGSSTHTTEGKVAGIQIQTSLLGEPIALGWGRTRTGCNLIDYVGFTAIPHTATTTTGGGKGGGSSSSTTYTYTASIILALCEGPITGVRTVYKDSSVITLSAAGLSLATGALTQSTWGYLTSLFPSHAIPYSSLAYVYAQDYLLGSGAQLSNHGFEIDFALQFGPNGDAVASDIATDFLTNVSYGVTGWTSGLIGSFADWALYCKATNLLLSPLLDTSTTGADFVKRLGDQTNSELFWSEGMLKAKPYGDTSVTGNSVTWNPNLTPIFDLNDDDFLDEVSLGIIDQSDAYNYVQIEYLDRSNQYQPAVAIAQDLDNIITYGLRKKDVVQMHDICDATIARMAVQLLLQRTLYIRDTYTFTLPEDFVGLEPMDYVTLTTAFDSVLLNRQLVLIQSIEEAADNSLKMTAQGVPGHTAHAALYPAHTSSGFQAAVDAAPGDTTAVVFNAPTSLATDPHEVFCAACGGANWGGCEVWISVDNASYAHAGTILNPARFGTLSASLASHADPDTTDTLGVTLSYTGLTLGSSTTAEADAGATLCQIDNELLSYATATLTGPGAYNLTYLRRGLRGSAPAAHSSGATFVRLDDAIFKFAYDPANTGSTVYVKLQSFNHYGRGLQSLAGLTPHTVTLTPFLTGPHNDVWLGAVNGPAEIVINANYAGTILDALPRTQAYTLLKNGVDKTTSATWSVSVLTGTMTASIGAATGVLSIDVSGGVLTSGRVRIIANYGGMQFPLDVKVTKAIGAAPSSGSGGGGSSSGYVSATITGTTMVAVGDVLTVTVGSGGNAALAADYSFTSTSIGSTTTQAQWYKWNGTAYVAIGSAVTSSTYSYYVGDPGQNSISYSDTGNVAASSQKYQLYAKVTSANNATLSGTCSAVGS